MPLSNINLAGIAGFGLDCMSDGVHYKIILWLGDDFAIACRASDNHPAQTYLIRIDPKPQESQDANKKSDETTTDPPAESDTESKPEKPVDTIH